VVAVAGSEGEVWVCGGMCGGEGSGAECAAVR